MQDDVLDIQGLKRCRRLFQLTGIGLESLQRHSKTPGRNGLRNRSQQAPVAAGRIKNAKRPGDMPCGSSGDSGQKLRQHRGSVVNAVCLRMVRCFFPCPHAVDYK